MTLRNPKLGRTNPDLIVEPLQAPSLSLTAAQLLQSAATRQPAEDQFTVEERSVWRPDSWILEKAWETLADAGAGPEAVAVAQSASTRQPVAPYEAIYRLARQATNRPQVARLVANNLDTTAAPLLQINPYHAPPHFPQQLLYAGAAAAHLGNAGIALSYMEKIDQTDRAWDRIVASPEQRAVLAEMLVKVGPHPLVLSLIDASLRRFGDGGAELLLRTSEQIDPAVAPDAIEHKESSLLRHIVDAFRFGALTTLHSHRIAAAVFARAGRFDEVLNQVDIIASVQQARRAGGAALRHGDGMVLRQVRRPQADADIDFQVYTLREAVHAKPLRYIPREARVEIARRLAELGLKSDGWTAAGAASTLAELGALKFAADVVQHIPDKDPTRSEGTISLVKGLLAVGDMAMVDEQVQKALGWARSYSGRNPERALIWGLAEAYLDYGHPDKALQLLDEWREDTSLLARVRKSLSQSMGDDDLRLKRLRFQALMAISGSNPDLTKDEAALLQQLKEWAPRLLDGEALIDFYADGLLRPLLTAGHAREAWDLLPYIEAALVTSTGEKHAARVRQVCALMARQVRLAAATQTPLDSVDDTNAIFSRFVLNLWQVDSERGLWQLVRGIDGSLPLVLALEGPGALTDLAHTAIEQGDSWT